MNIYDIINSETGTTHTKTADLIQVIIGYTGHKRVLVLMEILAAWPVNYNTNAMIFCSDGNGNLTDWRKNPFCAFCNRRRRNSIPRFLRKLEELDSSDGVILMYHVLNVHKGGLNGTHIR